MSTLALEDDDITIFMANVSARCPKSYKACALDHILQQYKFAGVPFCLKTDDAIADSGATQIFVMEGTPVVNKREMPSPLKVSLANGRQVMSKHMCEIHIASFPFCTHGTYNSGPLHCLTLWNSSVDGGRLCSYIYQG
jgi:hypothetical protein